MHTMPCRPGWAGWAARRTGSALCPDQKAGSWPVSPSPPRTTPHPHPEQAIMCDLICMLYNGHHASPNASQPATRLPPAPGRAVPPPPLPRLLPAPAGYPRARYGPRWVLEQEGKNLSSHHAATTARQYDICICSKLRAGYTDLSLRCLHKYLGIFAIAGGFSHDQAEICNPLQ